jgi:large subunit ribosomal protein L23
MTNLRHYDVIVAPAITEKSTMASEQNRSCSTSPRSHQAADQGRRRSAVQRQGQGVNTLSARARPSVSAARSASSQDVKKAIVTLARRPVDRRRHRPLRKGERWH